jgi:phosphoribosylformimino-5-aminoimidazole carboxamide ribotide isomerase
MNHEREQPACKRHVQLIPSMDLLGGQIVRLRKGAESSAEFYGFTPEHWIRRLVTAGACRIHLVDLDGAFGRQRQHVFAELPKRYPHVRFQLGGGLRTRDVVAAVLDLGFDAVVGTFAVESPEQLAGLTTPSGPQIIAALDMRGDRVQLRGWTADAQKSGGEVAAALVAVGVATALITDVDQDGMLQGPGMACLRAAASWGMRVQASGGVTGLSDLQLLAGLTHVEGAISGKALLDEKIALDDPQTREAFAERARP